MFLYKQEHVFNINKDPHSCPRTPTLPGIQELSSERRKPFRLQNLKINTNFQKNLFSPAVKTATRRGTDYIGDPIRKNLLNDFEKQTEVYSSLLPQREARKIASTISYRSMSSSGNDKCKYYMNEINTLNNKIKNLIKEQDTLRDILMTQENSSMNIQKDNLIKIGYPYHEIQSATMPQHESFDESFFQVTFKPQEK